MKNRGHSPNVYLLLSRSQSASPQKMFSLRCLHESSMLSQHRDKADPDSGNSFHSRFLLCWRTSVLPSFCTWIVYLLKKKKKTFMYLHITHLHSIVVFQGSFVMATAFIIVYLSMYTKTQNLNINLWYTWHFLFILIITLWSHK